MDCSEQETGTGSPGKAKARSSLCLVQLSEMGGEAVFSRFWSTVFTLDLELVFKLVCVGLQTQWFKCLLWLTVESVEGVTCLIYGR